MTTIRGNAVGIEKVLRVAWSRNEAVPESDDGKLPHIGVFSEAPIRFALERPLWRESGETFVFYDIYAGETIPVVFQGDSLNVGGTVGRLRKFRTSSSAAQR